MQLLRNRAARSLYDGDRKAKPHQYSNSTGASLWFYLGSTYEQPGLVDFLGAGGSDRLLSKILSNLNYSGRPFEITEEGICTDSIKCMRPSSVRPLLAK